MHSTLRTYLKEIKKDILHIKKSADPKTQIGDLCSQSKRPVQFENIKGFPGWKICDLLVADRQRQAIALKTTPENVVKHLAEKINKGPGKTKIVQCVNVAAANVAVWRCHLNDIVTGGQVGEQILAVGVRGRRP